MSKNVLGFLNLSLKYIVRPSLIRYINTTNKLQTQELIITDKCTKKLKNIVEKSPNGSFLRIVVEGGGCSGFQYKFDIDDKLNKDDKIFEQDGQKVVIDEVSFEYVKGSTVDYKEELISSAFVVSNNPNAEQGCSCGASFAIKLD